MVKRRAILVFAAAIVAATLAAYHNSFNGPFVFDDVPCITDNASIRQLWPLSGPLHPPNEFGYTVSGRPVLNLTLAVNYAISGIQPWSYHATNLLIHIGAALVLFGLLRRLLSLDLPRRGAATPPCSLKDVAVSTAGVATLAWALHPLQTESVTYTIQRAESLMGLFYLLTLYGFVRMAEPGGRKAWGFVSVLACLLGVGTKEVIVTAPVLVLLLDRVFFIAGLIDALRKRAAYYVALAATWIPLAWLVLGTGGDRGGTFQWGAGAFIKYWLTQPEALTRYLGLTLWPHPLIFEYGRETNPNPVFIAGCALTLAAYAILTIRLWRRHRPAALGLTTFLVVLAPTSLLPGVQVIVEHRMYLPLAGLLAVGVAAAVAWQGRRGLAVGAVLALAGGAVTMARNADYQDVFGLWADTVQKRPTSGKAHNNLAHAYHLKGEIEAALSHYRESLRLEPEMPRVRFNLGLALQSAGRTIEAIASYREALHLLDRFPEAHAELGILLAKAGQREEAEAHLKRAHEINPTIPDIYLGLGILCSADGREAEAIDAFQRALSIAPNLAEARLGLGVALARSKRLSEAAQVLRELAAAVPAMREVHVNLGNVLLESGDFAGAVDSYRAALVLDPGYANAHYNLGNALLRLQRWAEAREQFEATLKLDPAFEGAQEMLDRMKAAKLP